MTKPKALPPLLASHRPQHQRRQWRRNWPSRPPSSDELPYGFQVLENGDWLMVDRGYDPMWVRTPDGSPAERATMDEWISVSMYAIHDATIDPTKNKLLRATLRMVVEEFCAGRGGLWIRPWRAPVMGTLMSGPSGDASSGTVVVALPNGKFNLFEGRKLNERPLTHDQAQELAMEGDSAMKAADSFPISGGGLRTIE